MLLERHQHGGADLGQLMGDAGLGMIGQQGDISPARLENAEHADDHLGASLDAQSDAGIGRDPALGEQMGQLVGARVQLGVREHATGERQRGALRCARGLGLEQIGEALVAQRLARSGAESVGEPLLLFAQYGQRSDLGVRIRARRLREDLEVARKSRHVLGAEQAPIVEQARAHRFTGTGARGR